MKKNKTKKSRKGLLTFFIVCDVIMILAVVLYCKIFNFDDKIDDIELPTAFSDVVADEGDEEHNEKTLGALRDAESLSALLKDWADDDEDTYLSSRDILNFLLIGIDEGGANSDVIMLMSLDKNNEKIYLTSFMRDSYTYISTAWGDKYAKVNASYANGGAACLVDTLQRDYKIKIDYYASVNFKSFSEIVDIIGGVRVPVQAYEARACGNIYEYGDNVLLNGEQALMFCRIRKCDSDGDVSRTRRQRTFISALIAKSKEASVGEIGSMITTLLKYVNTDCSSGKLISLGTQAVTNKWYDYEIVNISMPKEEFRMDYMGYAWVWIVDYPGAAQYLQNQLYGYTNIELEPDRTTAMDIMRSGNSGEARP